MSWNEGPATPELLLDPKQLSPREARVETLIIGGGVAGYRAALEAAKAGARSRRDEGHAAREQLGLRAGRRRRRPIGRRLPGGPP